jgi:signal peptidase I
MPEAITVPKGAWFLAGDFRGESDDSRFWGPVPTKAITGVVKYRSSPLRHAGRL